MSVLLCQIVLHESCIRRGADNNVIIALILHPFHSGRQRTSNTEEKNTYSVMFTG